MECSKPSDFGSLKKPIQNSYESNVDDMHSADETNSSNKKKFGGADTEDCAQILNEEFFKSETRKKFVNDVEQPQLKLRQNFEELRISDLDKAPQKKAPSPVAHCSASAERLDRLRDIVRNGCLVSDLRKTLGGEKPFKSPEVSHTSRRIRGRLFVSISRIQQIKKNLKKSRMLRTINKPSRKLKMRPIQKKLIKREFLRKRKRDKIDLEGFAREVHCYRCNRLIFYSNNLLDKDHFCKTGDWEDIRLKDKFHAVEKLCPECEAKHAARRNASIGEMIPEEGPKERATRGTGSFFLNFQIEDMEQASPSSDEVNSKSDERNSLNLSEISLQNTRIKRNFQFKIEEASKIQKRNLSDVHDEQFICSSVRRTEYFKLYKVEGDKLKFEDNLDQKLRHVREDDDYDTDEEMIEHHKKEIFSSLLKGIKRATRRRR